MKWQCNNCGWVGCTHDGECPECSSTELEEIKTNPLDDFYAPEGDLGSMDEYYNNLGS